MKTYGIEKSFSTGLTAEQEMDLVNKFTRRDLAQEEVYTFPVILCDNEIDRDYEQFSVETLEELAGLFLGKTGIFDHNPRGENQTSRIYWAEARPVDGEVNSAGEPLYRLYAKAYMIRSEKNADLILEIDGGIKSEVSVGCAVGRSECSICGADLKESPCNHRPGKTYAGALCWHILKDATDAYEWSFVAVPAQRGAGVIKKYEKEGDPVVILSEETQNKLKEILDGGKPVVVEKAANGAVAVREWQEPSAPEAALLASDIPDGSVCKQMGGAELLAAAEYGAACKEALTADTLAVIQKSQGERFNADVWKSVLSKSSPEEIETQRKAFATSASEDRVLGEEIEKAVGACVGAIGGEFDPEKLRGVLKGMGLDDVREIGRCFDEVKKAALYAGIRVSSQESGVAALDVEKFKL